MSDSMFSGLAAHEIGFLFLSAMRYRPKIRSRSITDRGKTGFLLVMQGEYRYTFSQGSFLSKDRSLIILPKGASYSYQVLSKETEVMQIECELLTDHVPFFSKSTPFFVEFEQITSLVGIFEKIIDLSVYKPNGYLFSIQSHLFSLCSVLIRKESKALAAHKSKIFSAVSYIEANFTKKIQCAELADLCAMSESQLRRLFQREMGCSPLEYKRKLQLDYAITLLESENYQISQIADLVGFNNIYEFSAAFKKKTGKSPKKYFLNP